MDIIKKKATLDHPIFAAR